jgi:tripartite motif-containing protein 71
MMLGSVSTSNGANAAGERDFPQSIAIDPSGYVFVGVKVDDGFDKIQKFSSNGKFIREWNTTGSGVGQFFSPLDLAVDPSGYVYLADTDNHRIQKFTNTGKFIRQWGEKGDEKGEFRHAAGVAADKSGNVFVADDNNYRIQKFTNTGKFIKEWATRGPDNPFSGGPLNIAADPSNGNVFVTTEHEYIQKYSNNGKFIREWKPHNVSKYMGIPGIAVDNSGNVFVVLSGGDSEYDWSQNPIRKYSNTGKFIRSWGSFVSEDGQITSPHDIATDSLGNVYVVDGQNQDIQKFTNTGKFITKWNVSNTAIVNVNVFAMR